MYYTVVFQVHRARGGGFTQGKSCGNKNGFNLHLYLKFMRKLRMRWWIVFILYLLFTLYNESVFGTRVVLMSMPRLRTPNSGHWNLLFILYSIV
jgi:hypothetical protein